MTSPINYAQAIRLRPGMYLGHLNQTGIENQIADFLFSLNPIGQSAHFRFILDGDTICMGAEGIRTDKYKFYFDLRERNEYPAINSGLAQDSLTLFILACVSKTSKISLKTEQELYEVHGVANEFEIRRQTTIIPSHKYGHTIEMIFSPDKQIFKSLSLRFDYFVNFFRELSFLLPTITIELRNNITKEYIIFSNPRGMSDYTDNLFHQLQTRPIFRMDRKLKLQQHTLQVVIAYMPGYKYRNPIIKTWAEGDSMEAGSLPEGILRGIRKVFKGKNMNNNPQHHLVLCAHLRGDHLVFAGSTKDRLQMPELEKELENTIHSTLYKTDIQSINNIT